MIMNEKRLKIAVERLLNDANDIEPIEFARAARLFGVDKEAFAEGLLLYEETVSGQSGYIGDATMAMLEPTIKFMAILRHRENVGKIVTAAKTLISQKIAHSAEQAVDLAFGFDEDKPAIRSAAIIIVRQWMNEK